jgi:hypothetical protein
MCHADRLSSMIPPSAGIRYRHPEHPSTAALIRTNDEPTRAPPSITRLTGNDGAIVSSFRGTYRLGVTP